MEDFFSLLFAFYFCPLTFYSSLRQSLSFALLFNVKKESHDCFGVAGALECRVDDDDDDGKRRIHSDRKKSRMKKTWLKITPFSAFN